MAKGDEMEPARSDWKDSAKIVLRVLYVVAFVGLLSYVNAFYFDIEKLVDTLGGLIVLLLIGGFLVYVFWAGLKTVLSGKDKR